MPQIYINYAPADRLFALRLTKDLWVCGVRVWLDVHHIAPDRDPAESVRQALDDSHMMIVVLSPEALLYEPVALEWQTYLQARRPTVPVIAEPCTLPDLLRRHRPVDFTRAYRRPFHELVTRLIELSPRVRNPQPLRWDAPVEAVAYGLEQTQPFAAIDPDELAGGSVRQVFAALRDRLQQTM